MKRPHLKHLLAACSAAVVMMSASAYATTIGVSMAYFDDNFLNTLRQAMADQAKSMPDVKIQFEDARGDTGRQLNQVQNFVAQKVDAIIINTTDSSATGRMSQIVSAAGIPLVYVNRKPAEDTLPEKVVFVGSDENVSGTLEAEELAKQLNYKGNVAIMMGELATNAAELRTKGVEKVVAKYPGMKIVQKQTANFLRAQALDLMNNWIVSGEKIDAVAANNDEMAIGAILALQQAGVSPKKVLVGGIDATADALAEMQDGNLAVTVFQDAKGQGRGALESAVKLSKGEKVEKNVMVPFQLVTKDNYKQFMGN